MVFLFLIFWNKFKKNIEITFLFFKKKRKLFLDFKMIFQSSFKFLILQKYCYFFILNKYVTIFI